MKNVDFRRKWAKIAKNVITKLIPGQPVRDEQRGDGPGPRAEDAAGGASAAHVPGIDFTNLHFGQKLFVQIDILKVLMNYTQKQQI
jgi:hypothetical protein